jgi:ABC-type multidrug transport system fused ATPase/permease subunit
VIESSSPLDPPDLPLRPTARRLIGRLAVRRRLFLIGLASTVGVMLVSMAIPVLIQRAIDDAIVPRRGERLIVFALAILVLAGVKLVLGAIRRTTSSYIGIGVENDMRELLFDAFLRLPRAFYDRHATGQVLSRATNDLYPVRYFIGWGVLQTIQSVLMILGTVTVLAFVDLKLTLLTAIVFPLIALVAYQFARVVIPISRRVQQLVADLTELADEAVVGIEMVQAFGRDAEVRRRFGDGARTVRDANLQERRVEAVYLPPLVFLPAAAIATVLLVGGRQAMDGRLTLGQIVLFSTLLLQLAWPLEALGWILNLAQRAMAAASRSFAWLEIAEPLPEPVDPRPLPAEAAGIELAGVWFSYGGEEVLRGVDLTVRPGEVVAVCGATGAGKSTLLGLVSRLYDPTQGTVRMSGVDLRQAHLADVRSAVAIATQRPVLFSQTLRENIVAGRPDVPGDEFLSACRAAGVALFVDDLPDGYETAIGERGVNLSGGQRQRVALARALVSNRPVVVLDDPMSAVDTETERHLLAHLGPALAGRTVIVSTQRLSTLRLADRVVVLEAGRVVQSGTPTRLMTEEGAFAALFGDEAPVHAT